VVTTIPLDLPDSPLGAEVNRGLALVEDALQKAARTENDLLADASRYLIDAGGKRFRATLVLLSAHFGDPRDPRVVPGAVAIELTHLATLYHDDVMDEAAIRRGHESANSRWNNTVAILTGDFLFARASQILADLGAEPIRIQAETFLRLVTGQVEETAGPAPGQDPLEHYMRVIKNKTGSLIATAGRFGAMLSGSPDEVTARITPACEALGIAFQLSDDIIDVASDSEQLGKTPGTDLREGVRTLPVLHALRTDGPAGSAGSRLAELLRSGELTDPGLHAEALSLLRAHPAMDAARADLRRWSEVARREILALPRGPARSAFETLCDFVADRTG
jgi:heptaprenyl diphosphate synthase